MTALHRLKQNSKRSLYTDDKWSYDNIISRSRGERNYLWKNPRENVLKRKSKTEALKAKPQIIYYHLRESVDEAQIPWKDANFNPFGPLCAWLTLNEAVCLPKWTLPTPNNYFFPPSSPYSSSPLHWGSVIISIQRACLLASTSHHFVTIVVIQHNVEHCVHTSDCWTLRRTEKKLMCELMRRKTEGMY